jgi:hypothetical protein
MGNKKDEKTERWIAVSPQRWRSNGRQFEKWGSGHGVGGATSCREQSKNRKENGLKRVKKKPDKKELRIKRKLWSDGKF